MAWRRRLPARSPYASRRGPAALMRLEAFVGQAVRRLVAGVAGMALDPAPVDLVARGRRVQPLPQVLVLHRFLVGGAPAAGLPARQPFVEALLDVDRVGVERHRAGLAQRLQGGDRRHHLHAVVGGERFAATEFFLVAVPLQQGAPAAGARIAAAGAVGIDGDSLQDRSRMMAWWLEGFIPRVAATVRAAPAAPAGAKRPRLGRRRPAGAPGPAAPARPGSSGSPASWP